MAVHAAAGLTSKRVTSADDHCAGTHCAVVITLRNLEWQPCARKEYMHERTITRRYFSDNDHDYNSEEEDD